MPPVLLIVNLFGPKPGMIQIFLKNYGTETKPDSVLGYKFKHVQKLIIIGLIHTQDDSLHDTGSCKSSIRLPLISPGPVSVV
jgi:hypothetical protein